MTPKIISKTCFLIEEKTLEGFPLVGVDDNKIKLYPYQRDCLDAINQGFLEGKNRQMVSMATGGGKTIVFAHLIKQNRGKKILIIAHTIELLLQALQKIQMVDASIDCGIVCGNQKDFSCDVTICSIQSASQLKTLKKLKEKDFDILIYDEAHHAAANSSRTVLNHLGFWADTKKKLVGFSATPYRNDEKGLGEAFDYEIYKLDTKALIRDQRLCPPVAVKIDFNGKLPIALNSKGDFSSKSIARLFNTPEVREQVVDAYLENARDRKTICFTANIDHAEQLSYAFTQKGIVSESISGETPKDEREKILDRYRNGEIDVLCNCQILTEGFDDPATSCVIVARPTKSKILYVQMVGRGLRKFPNKNDCIVIDFCDKNHILINSTELLMDRVVGPNSFPEKEEEEEELQSQTKWDEEIGEKLGDMLKAYNPFGDKYAWEITGSVYQTKGFGDAKVYIVPEEDKKNLFFVKFSKDTNDAGTLLYENLDFGYAYSLAEDYIDENLKKEFSISNKNAPWKNDPITQKQIKFIRSRGFRKGLETLTKGDGAIIISSIKEKEPARNWPQNLKT